MLCVTGHMSHVTCHLSSVTCHMSHFFFLTFTFLSFFWQSCETSRRRVSYQFKSYDDIHGWWSDFAYIKVWANTNKWVPPHEESDLFFVRRFYTLYEQKCSNVRPLLSITFPQWFRKSKKFGHWTSGSGGKKMFKRNEEIIKNGKKLFPPRRFYTLY